MGATLLYIALLTPAYPKHCVSTLNGNLTHRLVPNRCAALNSLWRCWNLRCDRRVNTAATKPIVSGSYPYRGRRLGTSAVSLFGHSSDDNKETKQEQEYRAKVKWSQLKVYELKQYVQNQEVRTRTKAELVQYVTDKYGPYVVVEHSDTNAVGAGTDTGTGTLARMLVRKGATINAATANAVVAEFRAEQSQAAKKNSQPQQQQQQSQHKAQASNADSMSHCTNMEDGSIAEGAVGATKAKSQEGGGEGAQVGDGGDEDDPDPDPKANPKVPKKKASGKTLANVKEGQEAEDSEQEQKMAPGGRKRKVGVASTASERAAQASRATIKKTNTKKIKVEAGDQDQGEDQVTTKIKTKTKTEKTAIEEKDNGTEQVTEQVVTTTKKAATRTAIPKNVVPRRLCPNLTPTDRIVRILSWNVAGLRGMLKKDAVKQELRSILLREKPDIFTFQETKLQEDHEEQIDAELIDIFKPLKYQSFWSHSIAKKGYSGVAVFVRQSDSSGREYTPLKVHTKDVDELGSINTVGREEGRCIAIELDSFILVSVYVPNSGEDLKRLEYRIDDWDKDLVLYLNNLQARHNKHVVLAGDLNVAHLDADIYAPKEKRFLKAAGTTPQERKSFGDFLSTGYIDAFRALNPDDTGRYTYWSMRAGNRPYNRGLRLDYFVLSESISRREDVELVDCYILDDELLSGSDHGMIGLDLCVRGEAKKM